MANGKKFLSAGSIMSFGVALLHLVIIFIGADAYRYFGAGEEMALLAESGSLQPALVTFVITIFFSLFGLYGLSGANIILRLPFLKWFLLAIGSIYALRGLAVIGEIIVIFEKPVYPLRMIIFSLVSLIAGIFYLAGVKKSWTSL
ncbi:MAG: hypothetical protein HYS25_00355 [Ignavibacteriales bacterium]|nr:hypothetical protein [Ignavibacteriales bacterium]